MDNKEEQDRTPGDQADKADARPLEERLKDYVQEKETDENLKKLGKLLAAEWTGQKPEDTTPDLSFAKFEEKLKKSGDQ